MRIPRAAVRALFPFGDLDAAPCPYCCRSDEFAADRRIGLCKDCLEKQAETRSENTVAIVYSNYSEHVAAVQDAFYQPSGDSDA